MGSPSASDLEQPDARANYVIERIASSSASLALTDHKGWERVARELGWAYGAIDDAQRHDRAKNAVRFVSVIVLTYALVAVFQWLLDSLWDQGELLRALYMPALMVVPMFALSVAVFGFVVLVQDPWERVFGGLSFTLFIGGSAVWSFTVFLLVNILEYTFLQAVVISVFEPAAWGVLWVLWFLPSVKSTAADPRDQLVADLAALTAISKVTLGRENSESELDGRADGWSFPRMRWATLADTRVDPSVAGSAAENAIHREFAAMSADIDQRDSPILDRNHPEAQRNEHELDDPLPRVLRLDPQAWKWRQDREVRRAFVEGIEVAAVRIEVRLPKVIAREYTVVQASIHLISVRIAAKLRSYATKVALGGVEYDGQIADDFALALVSASFGRWDDLGSEEAVPRVERFLKRFGLRIIAAVILVAMGILVPFWFEDWIGDATSQFRIALLTAAAISLTEGPKNVVELVADAAKNASSKQS